MQILVASAHATIVHVRVQREGVGAIINASRTIPKPWYEQKADWFFDWIFRRNSENSCTSLRRTIEIFLASLQ